MEEGVTIICRPRGRGNWALITITVDVPADLFKFQPGEYFPFGDREFHIIEIRP